MKSHRIVLLLVLLALFGRSTLAIAQPSAETVRADFHRITDRPMVDLSPQLLPLPDHGDCSVTHLAITSETGQVVPGILLKQKNADVNRRRPVVIVLHGTGGNKEQNLDLCARLADRGFLAVAIDGRYHGERCKKGSGTDDYYAAIAQAYRDEKSHPWLFDTVFDVTRLIDYLQSRVDVDASRIGLIGFSKGGMETYLTAAIDPRIAVAVPCISAQCFAWGLQHDQWRGRIGTVQGAFDLAAKDDGVDKPDAAFVKKFYDRIVPGIDGEFDCPNLLPLIAPRPLLTINGDSDKLNPLIGVQIAIDSARKAYSDAGVADHLKTEIEPHTAHSVTPAYLDEAVDWLVKWLAPT